MKDSKETEMYNLTSVKAEINDIQSDEQKKESRSYAQKSRTTIEGVTVEIDNLIKSRQMVSAYRKHKQAHESDTKEAREAAAGSGDMDLSE